VSSNRSFGCVVIAALSLGLAWIAFVIWAIVTVINWLTSQTL